MERIRPIVTQRRDIVPLLWIHERAVRDHQLEPRARDFPFRLDSPLGVNDAPFELLRQEWDDCRRLQVLEHAQVRWWPGGRVRAVLTQTPGQRVGEGDRVAVDHVGVVGAVVALAGGVEGEDGGEAGFVGRGVVVPGFVAGRNAVFADEELDGEGLVEGVPDARLVLEGM